MTKLGDVQAWAAAIDRLSEEVDSLRASAAEKEEEIERQAARIAELESGLKKIEHWAGYLKPDDFKEPGGDADKQAEKAYITAHSLLLTPTGAKERIEKEVWEEAIKTVVGYAHGTNYVHARTIIELLQKRAEGRE